MGQLQFNTPHLSEAAGRPFKPIFYR